MQAFNLWYLATDWPLNEPDNFLDGIDDRSPLMLPAGFYLPLSYQAVGHLIVLALIGSILRKVLREKCQPDVVVWAGAAISLTFFLFTTRMHERYLLPALPLLLIAYRPTVNWWLVFLTVSAATTINHAAYLANLQASCLDQLHGWLLDHRPVVGDVTAVVLLCGYGLLMNEIRLRPPQAGADIAVVVRRHLQPVPVRIGKVNRERHIMIDDVLPADRPMVIVHKLQVFQPAQNRSNAWPSTRNATR